jgi:cell division protein FtsN
MVKQKRSSRGSTFYGLMAGLVIGLTAAAGVAFFVMHSPMPFVDKASRSASDSPIDPRQAPDPNSGLAGQPPRAPAQPDALGALIATLHVESGKATAPLPPPPVSVPAPPPKPVADGKAYLLQVGAFRVLEDAESLRARVILMGLPVQIQRAEVNGVLVNRVRVGPFERLDDMNKARARLADEKITANVVRQ